MTINLKEYIRDENATLRNDFSNKFVMLQNKNGNTQC
jgi:hypothetical protein